MGLKKYEIITVGSDKRVRALRSWRVQDRYVNIGDVGGIVYDEKTLSQDGACWLFRGNFGFPGARIGGDSIVDVGEAALSATGTPAVDILGSSVVVGSKLQFASDQTAADAVVLTANDFEQGSFNYAAGVNWETMKATSASYIRSKALMFSGGVPVKVTCAVEGYAVTWYTTDADGITTGAAGSWVITGAGVSFTVPAGQYFLIRLRKEPTGTIVPADAATAAITFTGTYETKLSIVDSRLEVGPATSTKVASIKPGGTYTMASGTKYPEAIIRNSRVSMNASADGDRTIRFMGQIIGSSAVLDANAGNVTVAGIYSNVKNLTASGVVTSNLGVTSYNVIQATNCNDFAVSSTIFPGLADAQTANVPFIFQGCNVPDGLFYHHAQIANTYKNIDFALASIDLGKAIASGEKLVSSEVEGMYRVYSTTGSLFGALVESYDSVSALRFAADSLDSSYNTTIYKDAYINGRFDFAGTNVFGNKARSHPLAQVLNVQPRVVQGNFSATSVGATIGAIATTPLFVSTPVPFRVNGAKGLTVNNLPAGFVALLFLVDQNNVITRFGSGAEALPAAALTDMKAFIRFSKSDSSPITPADLAGVTVTVYNGCKIVNTGATAINMKGSIRVEDNATLVNASVVGTGYFGGNSVVYYNPAVWASLDVNGTVFMKDNAVFAPTALTDVCTLVHMRDNAKFIGSVTTPRTSLSIIMRDNAIVEGYCNTRSGVIMSGNSKVTPTGNITVASRGILVMEENASIEATTAAIGNITLAGDYKGDVVKTWTGSRTITDVNEPEYDNNVKTQYDYSVKTEYDF